MTKIPDVCELLNTFLLYTNLLYTNLVYLCYVKSWVKPGQDWHRIGMSGIRVQEDMPKYVQFSSGVLRADKIRMMI